MKRETQVAPAQQTFLINSILSDPNAQCLTFGCGGLGVPGVQAAVKTGTSEPFDPKGPDAGKIGGTWAFGYTPDVVVGVWAGNTDRTPITNILSTSIAFRTMRDTMLAYFNGRPVNALRGAAGRAARPRLLQGAGPERLRDDRGGLLRHRVRRRSKAASTIRGQAQPQPGQQPCGHNAGQAFAANEAGAKRQSRRRTTTRATNGRERLARLPRWHHRWPREM